MITRQLFGIIFYNSVDAIDSLKDKPRESFVCGRRPHIFTLKLLRRTRWPSPLARMIWERSATRSNETDRPPFVTKPRKT